MFTFETNKKSAESTIDIFNSSNGDLESVNLLFGRHIYINTISTKFNRTLLMKASWFGHQESVEKLLKYKETNLNLQDFTGQTALILSIRGNRRSKNNLPPIYEQLLSRIDILVNIQDLEGYTALHHSLLAYVYFTKSVYGDLTKHREKLEKIISILLSKNIDVNTQDYYGNNALIFASMSKFLSVFTSIFEKTRDVNVQNRKGNTALISLFYIKTSYNQYKTTQNIKPIVQMLEILLSNEKIDINIQNNNGDTALMIALKYLKTIYPIAEKIVKLMVSNEKIDINLQNNNGNTVLMLALKHYKTIYPITEKIVKLMMSNEKIDINLQNNNGDTALMIALKHYKTINPIAEILLELMVSNEKIDINLQNNDGDTVLILALKHQRNIYPIAEKFVELMVLNEKIDINLQNNDGNTALMFALHFNIISTTTLMLSNENIDVNIQNNDGNTAFMIALKMYNEDIISQTTLILSNENIDINIQNNDGNTAFMIALKYNKYLIPVFERFIKLILSKKIDINHQNKNGDTALIIALYNGQYSCLMETYVNIDIRNLNYCQYFVQMIEMILLIPNLDINIQNNRGYSALMSVTNVRFPSDRLSNHKLLTQIIESYIIKKNLTDISINKNGMVPLINESKQKNHTNMKKLLKKGAKINSVDIEGNTAIMISSSLGDIEGMNILFSNPQIDLNIKNKKGNTASSLAYENNNIKALIEIESYRLKRLFK